MSLSEALKKTNKAINRFFIGDEYEDALINRRAIDLSVYRYPSISGDLNYRYYDEASQVFFNVTSAGILYRILPPTNANETLAEQLDSLLRSKLSEQHTFHVISVTHNKVGRALDHCAKQFSQPGLGELSLLGERLNAYWKKAANSKFFTRNEVVAKLNTTEVYIVVDMPLDGSLETIDEQAVIAELALFRRGFESALVAAQIGFAQCQVQDFLRLCQFYLNPSIHSLYETPMNYDEERLLNEQLTTRDFSCSVDQDGLYLEVGDVTQCPQETAVTVLTLADTPKEHALWLNLDLTNNIHEKNVSMNCNHIISVTYKVASQGKAQYYANRKTKSLLKKARSIAYSSNVAGTQELATQWKNYRDDLALKRTRSVKILYNVLLFTTPENQAQAIQNAKTSFAYSGLHLALCKKQQMLYFLASMPFMFSGHLEKDFSLPMMMLPMSSWNAVQFMPILSDWHGNPTGILLPTLRNQMAFLDPFSGAFGTGYNIAVSGMTRGGKSFFIQNLMLNVLFNGGDVFIIDVGGSYKKMAKLLGGVYLEYDNLAMNPFTHVQSITNEIDEIIKLFALLTLPKSGANEDDCGTLRQAILNAFHLKGCETLIDDVQAALIDLYSDNALIYPSAGILAKNLEPYCLAAEHGKAFNLPSKLNPKARVIVIDLQAIRKKDQIKLPVLLSVISQFQRRMFDSDRSKQKMCILDEAWQFIQGKSIESDYVVEGFRMGARHLCSFVTITQGAADYSRFEIGKVIWENAALKLIFKQESSSLGQYNNEANLFTDYEMKILNGFPKPQEVGYSEVLVKADHFSSFHRLFVDPFNLVALSSKGQDYQAVENYARAGLSYIEATDRVAREHYGAMYE